MNLFKQIFLVIILCICGYIQTHAQYDISFEIENCKEDTLFLCYYRLGGLYSLDTAVNNKNKFRFKSKREIDDGVYVIVNNAKNRYCDFLVSKDRKYSFTTKDENWGRFLDEKKSKEEKIYIEYLRSSNEIAAQAEELESTKQNMDNKDYDRQLRILVHKNDSVKMDFINKHPDHLFAKILLCSKPIDEPVIENIYTPDGKIDSLAMRRKGFNWYKRHYFDNVDLSCGELLRTPKYVFADKNEHFWSEVMKYEPADSILFYADYYISKTNNEEMFNFFVKDICNRYISDNIMGHDKVYVGMVDRYLKTGKFTALHPSDIDKNISRADVWRNLLLGKHIPNLACPEEDENSTWHALDELKSKYKILVFWSVECSHCATQMPILNDFYKQYKQTYDMEIFAVHTEGEISRMHEFVKKNDLQWINVNGLIANYNWREYFDIEKTPVIYILSSDNEILAKNVSAESLKQIFDILENGGFNL